MSTRTFTLTNTLVDPSNNPIVGLSVTASLLVPGGVPAVDTDTKAVVPDSVSAVTNGSGTYSLVLIYPGDISPSGCVYQINENGTLTTSPVSFAYASSINTQTWYTAGGPVGTVKCRLDVVEANGNPVAGRYIHITPQQNTITPDTQELSVFSSVDVLLDGVGRATFWLWPSSVLTPVTLYTCRVDGETTRLSFSVPASTVDPLGESILLHIAPFGIAMAFPIPSTGVSHDSNVPPGSGDPVQSPTTLDDDLHNLAWRTRPVAAAASSVYAAASFT